MKKVVVVDDEKDICEQLKEILSFEGYEVYTANDAEGGIKLIEEVDPDVCLLDIDLPDTTGIDMLTYVYSVNVILISGKVSLSKQKAINYGAVDFIPKPFKAKELIASIEASLDKSKGLNPKTLFSIIFDEDDSREFPRESWNSLLNTIGDNLRKSTGIHVSRMEWIKYLKSTLKEDVLKEIEEIPIYYPPKVWEMDPMGVEFVLDEKYDPYKEPQMKESGEKKKILVVDDEEKICEQLKEVFEENNYEVDIANDVNPALEKIKGNDYDVVLLDINLPSKSGLEVKDSIDSARVNVIFISGKFTLMQGAAKKFAREHGATDFISKPFSAKKVLETVNATLKKQECLTPKVFFKYFFDKVFLHRLGIHIFTKANVFVTDREIVEYVKTILKDNTKYEVDQLDIEYLPKIKNKKHKIKKYF